MTKISTVSQFFRAQASNDPIKVSKLGQVSFFPLKYKSKYYFLREN